MTEELKINLDKTLTSLKIVSIVAGALIAIGVGYMNIDARMDRLELDATGFKSAMEERTRAMGDDIREMKSDIKLLLNKLELDNGQSKSTQGHTKACEEIST